MAVTPDKYELPIAVADSAEELAQMLGVTPRAIYHTISRHKARARSKRPMKWTKLRIYKVNI